MARLPLLGGSYSPRSIIASAQRCINLFPERNPQGCAVPLTHYQRPGFLPLAQGDPSAVRGLYRASNGNGYGVIGQSVYSISSNFLLTKLGSLNEPSSVPVSFTDNGVTILLVDSSNQGYTIDMTTNTFALFVDPTGTFQGAARVDNIDGFVLWAPLSPGSAFFGSTLNNTLTIDPTYIAAKNNYPDPLQSLIVNRHEILLIGQLKSEIWYDAGGVLFPFLELPGAYIEHGTVATYSVCSQDISVYFLGQDLQGQGIVFRQRGYETKRISDHSLEFQLQQAVKRGAVLSDAIGYTYQQGGHIFYVLNFPSADMTWVYDESTEFWHQRCWTDSNGNLHRDRGNCGAFMYGKNVVGDWQNGTIYALDQNTYVDNVAGQEYACSFIRGFPHIGTGEIFVSGPLQGQPMLSDGHEVQFNAFLVDIACGDVPNTPAGNPQHLTLRWSDDRGRTWGEGVNLSLGSEGEYKTQPSLKGLGQARDRVFEITYSANGPAALNGAWVEGKVLSL